MDVFGGAAQQQQQQQQQQGYTTAPSPPFGLIVPGCHIRTDFTPIDPSGLKYAMQLTCPGDIAVPLPSIREVAFFLTPSSIPLFPIDHGVVVYWQIASAVNPNAASTGYELLGHISVQCPSAIFPTGWSEHEQTVELAAPNAPPVVVTIGISIEPIIQIQNYSHSNSLLSSPTSPSSSYSSSSRMIENRLLVAQKIASDLCTFMQSFDTGSNNNKGQMIVPTNIFDRWLQRFEARFRRDPNFFLKSSV